MTILVYPCFAYSVLFLIISFSFRPMRHPKLHLKLHLINQYQMFLYYQFLTSGFLFVRPRNFRIVGFLKTDFFRFYLSKENVDFSYILLDIKRIPDSHRLEICAVVRTMRKPGEETSPGFSYHRAKSHYSYGMICPSIISTPLYEHNCFSISRMSVFN